MYCHVLYNYNFISPRLLSLSAQTHTHTHSKLSSMFPALSACTRPTVKHSTAIEKKTTWECVVRARLILFGSCSFLNRLSDSP